MMKRHRKAHETQAQRAALSVTASRANLPASAAERAPARAVEFRMQQAELFERPSTLPAGFAYQPGFLTPTEEAALIGIIQALPLRQADYKQYVARRRIVSYGGSYDFTHRELLPAGPIPESLYPLRQRIADWTGIAANDFNHALINEYLPGTPLGWHRDLPAFESIVGVSLAGECRLRLRPYPPAKGRNKDAITLTIEPRSAYLMQDEARWKWQHAVSPTKELRYSITFRTLAPNAGVSG